MRGFVIAVDWIDSWIGRLFAASTIFLVGIIAYALLAQRALGQPVPWADDARTLLFGALLMMTGAYVLARNQHVRGNFLYRAWPPRLQAGIDLALHLVLTAPAMTVIIVIGFDPAWEVWTRLGFAAENPDSLPPLPLRAVIPLGACLLLLQVLAELGRCIICLRTGTWPSRPDDLSHSPASAPTARSNAGE